jgi:integrase
MLLLAAHAGLRRAEVAAVRTTDVERDLIGYSLRVRGKGGVVRRVPLSSALTLLLAELEPGWAFPSPRGGHLTPAHVGKLISQALGSGVTGHQLRHRFASRAYAAERDLRAVQELLGHARPETTARYTAVPFEAGRRAVDYAAG